MKFIKINPASQQVAIHEAPSFDSALADIGLKAGHVDFGVLSPNLSIVVYEYGLYELNSFFSLGQQMYAGVALVFRNDSHGETVTVKETDLKDVSAVLSWIPSRDEAERAIQHGMIRRPMAAWNQC